MTLAAIRVRLEQLKIVYQDPISLRGRLLRGVAWSMAGVLTVQGLKLVVGIVLARILGNVGYGELGIINSTIVTLGIFSGLGLGITATKYVAQLRSEDASRAGQVIGFLVKTALVAGVTMTVGVILLAPLIAGRILGAQHLTRELQLSALLLLLNTLNGVQLGALAGLESFQFIARLNVLDGVLFVVFASLGAWHLGLIGVVGAYVLVAFAKWAASQRLLRRACRDHMISISYRHSRADWHMLWTFALPALLVSLSSQPFSWLVSVILANQPDGYAELGVFNAAYAWTALLMFLPRQICQPSMPILASLFSQRQLGSFFRLIRSNLLLVLGASMAVAIPLLIFSTLIMSTYGEDFTSGNSVLRIILLAYVVAAGTLVFRDFLMAIGGTWWLSIYAFAAGVGLIGGLHLLGPSATNLAYAYLISFTILFLLELSHFLFVTKRIRLKAHSETDIS